MSRVGDLLDQVLKDEGEMAGRLTLARIKRKASRQLLSDAANLFRSCAALLDEAAALLKPPGDPAP